MGIGPHAIKLTRLIDEANLLKQGFTVIELGSQDFAPTLEKAKATIAAEFGYDDTDNINVPANLYRRMGSSRYDCIDLDGYHGSHVFDLNRPLIEAYDFSTKFDLVTNHGTTEHLFNQMIAFENVHNLTEQGGVIVHALPFQGYQNHGMFNYNPSLFLDLSLANDYDVFGLFLSINDELFIYDEDFLSRNDISAASDVLIMAVMIKRTVSEFKAPYDGRYFALKGRGEISALENHIGSTRRFGGKSYNFKGLAEIQKPVSPKYRFITPIWGKTYVKDFIGVTLPSLLSEGNLLAFDGSECVYTIVTCATEKAAIVESNVYKRLCQAMRVEFILHSPDRHEHAYDRMSRCYNLALDKVDQPQTCFFLTSDDFYADGLFRNAKRQLDAGKRVVMVPTIRVVSETFSTELELRGVESLPPSETVDMMLRHEHPMITSCVVNDPSLRLHRLPSQTLYRSANGYIGRWNVMHPLAVKVPAKPAAIRSTVDWNYPALNISSVDDIYVVRDSDAGIIASMAPYSYAQSEEITRGASKQKRIENLKAWVKLDWALNFHVFQMSEPVYVHTAAMSDAERKTGLMEVDSVWEPFHLYIVKHRFPVPASAKGFGLDMLTRAIQVSQFSHFQHLVTHARRKFFVKIRRKTVSAIRNRLA